MFTVLKLLFLVFFCYGECRGKSFQPNIFHVLLLLWLRCPKSSLKSPYWCCQSNSCERKDALSKVMLWGSPQVWRDAGLANWVQSSAFVVKVWQLWVSKKVKPAKFIHYHLCLMFVLFRHFYFRRLSRSLKSQRTEVTFIFEKKSSIFCLERFKRVLFGLLV